jgi:hypothetical protein
MGYLTTVTVYSDAPALILQNYSNALTNLLNYFGYKETCDIYPIDMHLGDQWRLEGNPATSITFDCEEGGDELPYIEEIPYWKNNPNGHVYRTKYHTMVLIQNSYGSKDLMIFDNSKEVKQDV